MSSTTLATLPTIVFAVALAALAGAGNAQNCIYTMGPDPFGSPATPTQSDRLFRTSVGQNHYRAQILLPSTLFQNVPVRITDIAVGARSGWLTYSCPELRIRIGYSNASQFGTTFAQNVTGPLQDVLVANQHVWTEGPGPAWVPLGLQTPFDVLPGNGDLLIDITLRDAAVIDNWGYDGIGTGSVGLFVYGFGSTPPTQATSGVGTAPRLRLCVDHAEATLQGRSCNGSGGSTPLLGVTGRPTPGATPTIWLSDAPPNAIAACAYGFDTRPPFPVDLTPLGAPGCRQYFAPVFADVVLANNLGIGQRTILIPSAASTIGAIVYAQYFVLDPPANALDLTSSNYARLLVGL
jgi:hypothetical protein